MSITELFSASNNNELTTSSRSLQGTAELTALATNVARTIISTMNDNAAEYTERIQLSTKDAAALDSIINELMPEDTIEAAQFLSDIDDVTLDNMLKSQQSKRSRAKSKSMTLDNYTTLMTAAIAETLIRQVTGKDKSSSNRGARGSIVDYTIAQIEAFTADQEALRKEIRNIQSKKSIMKSKAGFSVDDERWIALCRAEQQLKDLRVSAGPTVVKVDETKNALTEKLSTIDISKLKSAEAHALLESIKDMIAGDQPEVAPEIATDDESAETTEE